MDQINSSREWNQKEGTLSEKTAFKEFGLTEDDIITAINPTSTCSKYAKPVFGGYGNKKSGDIKMRVF